MSFCEACEHWHVEEWNTDYVDQTDCNILSAKSVFLIRSIGGLFSNVVHTDGGKPTANSKWDEIIAANASILRESDLRAQAESPC